MQLPSVQSLLYQSVCFLDQNIDFYIEENDELVYSKICSLLTSIKKKKKDELVY